MELLRLSPEGRCENIKASPAGPGTCWELFHWYWSSPSHGFVHRRHHLSRAERKLEIIKSLLSSEARNFSSIKPFHSPAGGSLPWKVVSFIVGYKFDSNAESKFVFIIYLLFFLEQDCVSGRFNDLFVVINLFSDCFPSVISPISPGPVKDFPTAFGVSVPDSFFLTYHLSHEPHYGHSDAEKTLRFSDKYLALFWDFWPAKKEWLIS